MALWLTLIAGGLLTFGIRLSFILLLGRWQPTVLLQRSLRFVPPAVLTAIIVPELVLRGGTLNLAPSNLRLVAGLLAIFVAWRSRNALLTIGIGMAALWILQFLVK
jgi:branched-subunit amino acid transport protein